MIRTTNLRKEFGKFIAVNQVNLEVQKGDVFALIGPNGAGKTTLLKMLTGLLEPSYGKVFINQTEVNPKSREHFQFIGFMPDIYSLYEDLTVAEYLDYFASCHLLKGQQKESRIKEVIGMVNLEIKTHELVKGLSKGMKQRLLLAKTLLHDPQVLFLDEPASGLDPKARLDLRQIIKGLQHQGKTMIVSSHILSELSDFCNAYGIMEKGQFVKTGRFEHFEEVDQTQKLDRTIYLEVLHSPEKLTQALESEPGHTLKQQDLKWVYEFPGTREELASLLQRLSHTDIPLVSFYEKQTNIEDLFMQFSQHEVS